MASYSLTGRGLTPSSGGTDPLVVTVTGGDTTQLNLAAVACEVSATGGTGSYTYAWTLTDPLDADRTALLDDDTIADPVFTPDMIGGGGKWVARCTVTSGAQSVTVTKIVTVGKNQYVRVFNYDTDGATNVAQSGGTLTFGGKTFTVINAAADSSPKIDAGDLLITPDASEGLASTSTRTAPGLTIALSDLDSNITMLARRRLLVLAEIESWSPSATNEAIWFGLEQAANPLGSGASGRGVFGGAGFSTTLKPGINPQDSGGGAIVYATATVSPVASLAVDFANGAAAVYASSTAGAYNTVQEVLDASPDITGGARGSSTVTQYNRFALFVTSPDVGAGPSARFSNLSVWIKL